MRRRLIGSVLVCLFSASIFAAGFSANSPGLRVNEGEKKGCGEGRRETANPVP
jgi:hypothetical protein